MVLNLIISDESIKLAHRIFVGFRTIHQFNQRKVKTHDEFIQELNDKTLSMLSKDNEGHIDGGLISFINSSDIEQLGFTNIDQIVRCIIPKNTLFTRGKLNGIAVYISEELIT